MLRPSGVVHAAELSTFLLEKARITRNFASERPHEVPSHLLPPEHPRRQFSTVKAGLQLAHDQMPACAVERLFQWDALTDFIGAPTLTVLHVLEVR